MAITAVRRRLVEVDRRPRGQRDEDVGAVGRGPATAPEARGEVRLDVNAILG